MRSSCIGKMIGCSDVRNRLDAWDMMGSRVSRASNRVESACTRNPLEQQTRHLPFGDQLHRLPGARPMQAPDASCYKRSICEPSHSLHPHATHRADSQLLRQARASACLRHPRDPRASLSHSLSHASTTAFVHCARALGPARPPR